MNQPADYYFVSPKMRLLTLKNLLACLVSLWCLVEASPVSYDYGVSTYQAPAPAYQPPSYGYQEPAYQAPAYQPPSYGYQEPAYQPPSYGYQEPAYQPPSYGYQEPKSYSYEEPKSYYKPQPYETYETYVDYMPANYSKKCGVLPAVHHHSYGYKDEFERQAFGEYPWQVAIMDSYYNYLCAGAIIAPRFAITSSKCVKAKAESDIRVRIGEYDLSSNHNYLEAYKNYEVGVCKKHEYAPASYGSYGGYSEEYSYDIAILELQEEVDFNHYPQASTLCLPEYYEKPKPAYPSYNYQPPSSYGGYGSSSYQQPQPAPQQSAGQELECWVGGWKQSPLEKIKFQAEKQDQGFGAGSAGAGGYGYSYKPKTYYDYYEASRTPRKARVHKVYEYESYSYGGQGHGQQQQQQAGGYGYGGYQKPYKTENWEAEYNFDACHADQGAPVFCLVPEKPEYSYESYAPQYTPPPTYEAPSYQPPSYEPAYQPPSYGYQEPSYQAPAYQPPSYGYQEPAYQPPSYGYQEPSYQAPAPAYQPPSYGYQEPAYQAPAYQPSYSPPAPSYNRYKRAADYYQPQPSAYGYQDQQYSYPKPAYGYQEPSYQPPSYGYQEPAYQAPAPAYQPPSYGYQEPAYQPPNYGYQEPAYQAPAPAYQPPSYGYQEPAYYEAPITAIAAEKKVDDYKRAVLVGVVSYGTTCSSNYGYGYNKQESKKIQVTPVKNLVDWILGVLKSANSCYASYGYSSYSSYQSTSYSSY